MTPLQGALGVASVVWNSSWAMSVVNGYAVSYLAWTYGPSLVWNVGRLTTRRIMYG
jgi:hypothetical protein